MSIGLLNFFINTNQESYLTLNPTITYFNAVFKTHTNFAIESILVPSTSSRHIDNNSYKGFNTLFSYEIPRAGDLMSKMYVQIKLPLLDLKELFEDNDIKNRNKDSNTINILIQASKVYAMVYTKIKTFCASLNNHDVEKQKMSILQYIKGNVHLENFYSLIDLNVKKNNYKYVYGIKSLNIENILSNTDIDNKCKLLDNIESLIQRFSTVKNYLIKQQTLCNDEKFNNNWCSWVKKLGYAIINTVAIYIGGQKIDEHTGTWLNVWYQLSGNISMRKTLNEMIGNVPCLTICNKQNSEYILQIPLEFWFCRHYASSLPLSSLQYQKVRIELTTSTLEKVLCLNNNKFCDFGEVCNKFKCGISPELLIDYIYLGKTERMKFACESQEYIIDQLQIYSQPIKDCNISINLDYFVNPVREFIWVLEEEWNQYSCIDKASIMLYDSAIIENQPGFYFNYVQPYQHHNQTPQKGIYNYSFSLYPEELQVSGTANFSVIKGSKLLLTRENIKCRDTKQEVREINEHCEENEICKRRNCTELIIFARSINVLRFIDGYGGLAFTYG